MVDYEVNSMDKYYLKIRFYIQIFGSKTLTRPTIYLLESSLNQFITYLIDGYVRCAPD